MCDCMQTGALIFSNPRGYLRKDNVLKPAFKDFLRTDIAFGRASKKALPFALQKHTPKMEDICTTASIKKGSPAPLLPLLLRVTRGGLQKWKIFVPLGT